MSPEGASLRRLVGRTKERERLATALAAAIDAEPRVMQVVGEGGVGKTTLARDLAEFAADAGTTVVWVRCIGDTGAPPYHAWVQVLRAAVPRVDPERLLGHHPGVLRSVTQLDQPSFEALLRATPTDVPIPSGLDPSQARFALFEAVAAVLSQCAERDPMLVVFDDVHHADAASVLLLQFVARSVSHARLLIVTTGRRELPELADDSDVVPLRGLSTAEISSFFQARTGAAPALDVVEALRRATAGNPLFLEEVMATGSESVSEALGDMLRRRLARMPQDAAAVLTAYAILGEGLPAVVVCEVAGLDPAAFVEATDAAVTADLLVDAGGGPHEFSHPLIREALYASLAPGERRRWHLRAAEALERLDHDIGVERRHVGRAYHRREALPLGDPMMLIEATLQTSKQAMRTMAFENAASMLKACLNALDRLPMKLAAERCQLLVALAEADSGAGQRDDARESARKAAGAARRLGSPLLLADAALAMPRNRHVLQPDTELAELLREALAGLGPTDAAHRVRLLVRLAQEFPTAPPKDLRELADEAGDIAARLDHPNLAALAHRARQEALWAASDGHEVRLASASEMVRLAREMKDVELELDGHMWRTIALLELGRIEDAETALLEYRRLAEEVGHPAFLMLARSREATFALLRGQFSEGERLTKAAHDLARACGSQEGDSLVATALGELYFERRDDDALARDVNHAKAVGLSSFVVALRLVQLGRHDEGRAALRRGVEHELAGHPVFPWLASLAAGARAARCLGDADAARPLYEALVPHAHLHVVIGGAVAYLGPVTRYLGLCAAASLRSDVAVDHLESALQSCEHAAALPLVARMSFELSEVLASQATDADSDRAKRLGERALGLARSLGMERLVDEAEDLLSRLATPSGQPVSLRRQGDHWTLSAGGTVATLRHSRGLEQLARLLSMPNQEVSAIDLLSGTATTPHSGSAPVLDDKAKAAYRRRLRQLDQELSAAAKAGDVRREQAADTEREAVLRELRRAVGLGGRDRSLGSEAERARVNVTRTLRHALDQIAEVAPQVGAELRRSVRTGTYCCYRPRVR